MLAGRKLFLRPGLEGTYPRQQQSKGNPMSEHTHEEPKKPATDELNENELETVSGGGNINPQPLPPHHPPNDD